MSKRSNGEGTRPKQRRDGSWRAQIRTVDPSTGERRRQDVYGKTAADVADKIRAIRNDVAELGGYRRPSRTSVEAFLEQWLRDVAASTVRPSTLRSYTGIVRNHLIPTLGAIPIARLTAPMVARATGIGGDDPASPRTRELMHVVLRAALDVAVRWELVRVNVAALVDKPYVPRADFQVLSPAQVTTLLATAKGKRLSALYLLAIFTGLRQGELLALTWDDVDLDDGHLEVRYTLEPTTRERVDVKTKRARRRVDISPTIAAELKAHRTRMLAEGHPHGLIFPGRTGGPLRASNFTRESWKPLLCKAFGVAEREPDAAGDARKKGQRRSPDRPIVDIRFHDLRHTAATLMLLAGIHPKVVSERLGHATIAITLDTYSHVLPSMQKDAAVTLDRFLAVG